MLELQNRRRWKRALSWIFGALALAWLIHHFATHPEELAILWQVELSAVALVMALRIVVMGLQSKRYQLVIEKFSGQRLSYLQWTRYFVIGRMLNKMGPTAGTIYRGIQLKHTHDISYTRYITGMVFIRWLDTNVNLLLMLVVVASTRPAQAIAGISVLWSLVCLSALALPAPFLAKAVLKLPLRFPGAVVWATAKVKQMLEAMTQVWSDKGHLVHLLSVTVPIALAGMGALHASFVAFGLHVPLSELMIYYAALRLSMLVYLTPGNLGIREVLFGLLGETMGLAMSDGVLVSLLNRIVSLIALGATAGVLALLPTRRTETSPGTHRA